MSKHIVRLKRHYHYDTDNISFIKMHKTLKDLGINNNKFFLLIYDESIKNLDPFDEDNLTDEQKIRIKREVKRNPWYFLRQIARIPVPGGSTRFAIHRGNLAIIFCMMNNIHSITELPRQNFKTQSTLAYLEWVYDFGTENSEMNFLHKKFEDSKLNLERLKKIRELLPTYLLPKISKSDSYNLTNISNSKGNSIIAKNSAISEEQADLLGRGNTSPITLYDEVAFIKFLETIYTSASPSLSQASLEAEERGKPHYKVFLTTPGNVRSPHGKYCKEQFIDKACEFNEKKFYDGTKEEILEYIDKNSENDFVYIKFNYKQIGRDEKWFRDQCRSLNNNREKINREILLTWNKSTDLSPFAPESIERLRSFIKPVIATVPVNENYILNVYEVFNWTDRFLIGGDFGGQGSLDATCFSIVDPVTFHVLADFKNNKADHIEISDVIYDMMYRLLPNSIFVPEQNAYSDTIISLLLRTDVANRIYYEYKDKLTEVKMDDGFVKNEKIKTKVYGINTNKASREKMINMLFDIVENEYESIGSGRVIDDICGLERNKQGKIEAVANSGNHDDSLFSYLMTRYVMAFGTNLGRFKIYKKFTGNAESNANKGLRSDEEYVRNFSNVLRSNFSIGYNTHLSDLNKEIIETQREIEQRKLEKKKLDAIENGLEDRVSSAYSKIFSYNSLSNEARTRSLNSFSHKF